MSFSRASIPTTPYFPCQVSPGLPSGVWAVNLKPRGITASRDLMSNEPHSHVRPWTTAPSLAFNVMPVHAQSCCPTEHELAKMKSAATAKRLQLVMWTPFHLEGELVII